MGKTLSDRELLEHTINMLRYHYASDGLIAHWCDAVEAYTKGNYNPFYTLVGDLAERYERINEKLNKYCRDRDVKQLMQFSRKETQPPSS